MQKTLPSLGMSRRGFDVLNHDFWRYFDATAKSGDSISSLLAKSAMVRDNLTLRVR
jgi:hypothetical protein